MPPSTNGQQLLPPRVRQVILIIMYVRNCVMRFGRSQFSHAQAADDHDDNLIVFPPKAADDNSYKLIYSVPVHWKIRPECGTTLNMTHSISPSS